MTMQFSRDKDGAPIATGEGKQRVLADFLQSDIQDDAIIARELLEMADEVARGALGRYEFTGNAHELTLRESGATLVESHGGDDRGVEIPLADFRRALSGWLTFIT